MVHCGRNLHFSASSFTGRALLASQWPAGGRAIYRHGRLHGLCQQWNQRGELLGLLRVKDGTGIQREWFDNGRLQLETSTVAGKFTGRTRVWLQDGTLVAEQFGIENHNVTPAAYAAAAKHPDYPRYPASKGKMKFPDADEIERREFELQVAGLLAQTNKREALRWLKAGAQKRSLGLFKLPRRGNWFKSFILPVLQIFAVSIYSSKNGKQFSDALLVKLPGIIRPPNLRDLLVKLPAKLRAGVLPAQDQGEKFLFASFV